MAGDVVHQLRVPDGGGVDGHLVGTGIQQAVYVLKLVDASTYRKRDADFGGYPLHQFGECLPSLVAGGDVQVHQFVGSLFAIGFPQFYRVARLAQVHEIGSFHGLSVLDVQTGDDTFGKHNQMELKETFQIG